MELPLLALLTFIAAVIGTMTGFGTSTVMVPVLVMFFPVPVVLLFVGILHWCGDVWKMLLFRKIRLRIALAFGVPAILLSIAGASLVLTIPHELMIRALGVFLILYAVSILVFHMHSTMRPGALSAMLGGGLSGFCIGLFGFGGELRTVFLTLYRLPKEVYLGTIGAVAFMTDIARIATYWLSGVRLPDDLLQSLLVLIPVTLLGAWAAKRFLSHVPEQRFQAVLLIGLLLIGAKLVIAP